MYLLSNVSEYGELVLLLKNFEFSEKFSISLKYLVKPNNVSTQTFVAQWSFVSLYHIIIEDKNKIVCQLRNHNLVFYYQRV